jgi:hypothetical protein
MNWLYQYSIGEFLEAINANGKFFDAIGPLVKFEIELFTQAIKMSVGPIGLLIPDSQKIIVGVENFQFFKLYDRFKASDVRFTVDKVKELVKTEHDKLDLMAATRVPSVLYMILSTMANEKMDKNIIYAIQSTINQLDELHGYNHLLDGGRPQEEPTG